MQIELFYNVGSLQGLQDEGLLSASGDPLDNAGQSLEAQNGNMLQGDDGSQLVDNPMILGPLEDLEGKGKFKPIDLDMLTPK